MEYVGQTALGVKAMCQYDYNTNLFSIHIVYVSNDDGRIPITMTGYFENLLPRYVNETFTTDGQVFYYEVERKAQINGTITFSFENYSATIPMNTGIDIR